MLPYPFLGLEDHKFFTDLVKNVLSILAIFDSKRIIGKVQCSHGTKLMIFSEWTG